MSLFDDKLNWAQLHFLTTYTFACLLLTIKPVRQPAASGAAPFINHLRMGLFVHQLHRAQLHFSTTRHLFEQPGRTSFLDHRHMGLFDNQLHWAQLQFFYHQLCRAWLFVLSISCINFLNTGCIGPTFVVFA